MAVYVDNLFEVDNKQWCHMTADSEQELHEFAQQTLGLKRSWCHVSNLAGRLAPHYDLTPGKRLAAIRSGAKPLGRNLFLEKVKSMVLESEDHE